MAPPNFADILAARERIARHIHRTPVLVSSELDARAGARLFFKCENFQKGGAFKARGAHNAVFALAPEAAAAGVVTHSSGNHGAALALAARRRGIPAYIVVPENALPGKIEAIRRYGGEVTLCAPTLAARESSAAAIAAATGARLVHPYNDPWVIAGQGTAALELLEDVPDLTALLTPLGGGGLLSGTALAAHGLNPAVRVFGAEPAGADDGARSLRAGRLLPQTDPRTLADGLRSSLGEITFAVIQREVAAILTVSEAEIVAALRLTWEVLKMVIEPSSAVVVAAALARPAALAGQRVGLILSGGNADLDRLPWRQA
jgi:threonine dehydratase